ncbi:MULTISPECIES: hybrid sensor histidine kinase/response regulator [unclassified Sphingobacterium]|uniref:ATP-binding response regulator n=1 Tax=unclassified Sphingobacterium TaxID=2609468 RepID=UPI00104E65B5|nr:MULTISPECIES: hybrid sensor histidine kinase/response regulator [unclassified Sphingobacterium]MCS3553457.1 signal transduction histidine kinase [Sphingobacterium sp. JUb21]TCR09333.1 phospho-acceptor domain-containing protein [Sphingobacterium sp. JUb20]
MSTLKKKKTFLLRALLIGALIASFIYLGVIFIYQYYEQQKVKERLDAAYASSYKQSSGLDRLFSVYSEAENLFRLYTVNFDKPTFSAYKNKLDTIRYSVDSLSKLPLKENLMQVSAEDMEQKKVLSQEFATLKQTVDQLIFFTKDSLSVLSSSNKTLLRDPKFEQVDSIVKRIMSDTSFNTLTKDTTIRKKENLFKRIFKAKNDTLVAKTIIQDFNTLQKDVISRNIAYLIQQNKKVYRQNLKNLQEKFVALQDKEKQLVLANRSLLDNLRKGIDVIKSHELALLRKAEKKDLALYKESTHNFRNQLIGSFIIIGLSIILIFFYQSNAVSYERKLQEEKDYASQVAAEKTTILASVSHEVRSPINALQGIISILRKNNDSKLIHPEYLNSASHEIDVINSTVNDILNLSKLEAGAMDVQYDYFAPHQLLLNILNLHNHQAQNKNITIVKKIEIDPTLLIYSSEFRMKQIISNLISNAIKYTSQGEVSITASLKLKNGKTTLFVAVQDSGIGILEEEQALVFRQYYMAGAKKQTSSFGLGLYISKLFAQQMEGNIDLVSTLGKGSIFTLVLPVEKTKILETTAVQYTLEDLPQEMKIVIIDDNRINVLYLNHYFKDFPNVHIFEQGHVALAYMDENDVDVVITDLRMADLDGWGILNKIRAKKEWELVRVFVFTADSMYLEAAEQKQVNLFDAKLKKPLDAHDLISSIKRSMG